MTWRKLGFVAVVIAVLFAVPVTRRVVLLVLPLGSGIDDVVFLAAVLVASIVFGGKLISDLAQDTHHILAGHGGTHDKLIFLVIVGTSILVVVLMVWMFLSV